MRLMNMLTIGMYSCLVLWPLVITRAQEGPGGLGGPIGSVARVGQGEYEVKHADGSTDSGYYVAHYNYVLAPGWAKPRRLLGSNSQMGGGSHYLAMRSGQPKQAGNAGEMTAQSLPEGGLVMAAIVLAKADNEPRAQVIVGKLQPPSSTGEMGGYDGGPSAGGMSGMPGMGAGMEGGAMGGMGGMGMAGDMMGGSMGDMMGPINLIIRPLEECKFPSSGSASNEQRYSVPQLKNIAELVRVDCWIEEELATLRKVRQDAEKFKVTESSLKDLLNREYELQLSKQREDIERLNEKLKALQGELARRASAQDRVVDVQLGQLILEAQGLIGERP